MSETKDRSRLRLSTGSTLALAAIAGGIAGALFDAGRFVYGCFVLAGAAWLTWLAEGRGRAGGRRGDVHAVDPSLSLTANQLASVVERQWRAEAQVRGLLRPSPLSTFWHAADLDLMDHLSTVLRLPVSTRICRQVAGPLSGELAGIADWFSGMPWRRVVIIGPPGSGKTAAVLMLTLRLLERRASGDAVPVLLSAVDWDPIRQPFDRWVSGQVAAVYSGLEDSVAASLMQARLLLPVVDGLDEMPSSARERAIRSINRCDAEIPIVITSREEEYRHAVAPADRESVEGRLPEVLSAAAVVRLQPLIAADVVESLRLCTHPGHAGKWDSVLVHVRRHPSGPLAAALSTPLMASLARAVYSGTTADPAALLAPSLDRALIEGYLLDEFVPAAYGSIPEAGRLEAQWTQAQVTRYWRFLARQAQRRSHPDIAWWRLQDAIPVARMAGALAALLAAFGVVAAGLPRGIDEGLRYGDVPGHVLDGLPVVVVIWSAVGLIFALVAWLRTGVRAAPGRSAVVFVLGVASAAAVGVMPWPKLFRDSGGLVPAVRAGAQELTLSLVVVLPVVVAFVSAAWVVRLDRVRSGRCLIAGVAVATTMIAAWTAVSYVPATINAGVAPASMPELSAAVLEAAGIFVLPGLAAGAGCAATAWWTVVAVSPAGTTDRPMTVAQRISRAGLALWLLILLAVLYTVESDRIAGGFIEVLLFGTVATAASVAGWLGASLYRSGQQTQLRLLRSGLIVGAALLVITSAEGDQSPVPVAILGLAGGNALAAPLLPQTLLVGLRRRRWLRREVVPVLVLVALFGALIVWFVRWLLGWSQPPGDAAYLFIAFPVIAIIVGLPVAVGAWLRTPTDITSAASPRSVLGNSRRAALLPPILFCLCFALLGGLGSGLADGPTAGIRTASWIGLAALISFGLSMSLDAAWIWYAVARSLLTFQRNLPRFLMTFLDDGHRRGILRRTGITYQFRHTRLQERLAADTPAASAARSSTSPTPADWKN